jgi:predicted acylesterase/phospholipase RssA
MNENTITFNNMVLAGGALKSLSAIGCIKCLEEEGIMKNIRNFVGTSAGSIICLFAVLGYTSDEMISFIKMHIVKDYISNFNIEEIFDVLDTFGLNSGVILERFVSEMLMHKIKIGDATFLELSKLTGKNLIVCVANITKEHEEFWYVDTTPSMSIIKAIRTSCSLPVLFTPVIHKGDLYIDGGIFNNFPINFFKNNTLKDIIGVNVIGSSSKNTKNFIEYLSLIYHTVTKRLSREYSNDLKNNVITLEFIDDSWISLEHFKIDLQDDKLTNYITRGYDKMKETLNNILIDKTNSLDFLEQI